MAADITARTEAAILNTQDASTTGPSPVQDPIYDSVAELRTGFGQLKRLSTVQRGELSKKFGVPIHVFGNKHRRRGATDAEILALEVSHDRIENYLDQMFELIPEIAVSQPSTYAGISAKLEFVSELVNDNDQLRLDLVAKIVGNCAEQLASISTRELATQ
ncbi:hypothetical protein A8B78_11080 [Jannaschia sp. EhC01]|nr:hypothetical protein A8B78_11080 [Jannaschia sp. EhC01]